MSEPHEPSYYEIALTNRQVTVAFVILLVCLVGAFFSGVWVGRTSAAPEVAAAKVAPAPQTGQAPLEEFHFFSDSAKGEKSPSPSATAVTPPEPAAAPAVPPVAGPSPSPVASPTPEILPPAGSPSPSASVAPSESPRPSPTAKPSPSAPAVEAAPAELEPGEMAVQVFSSSDGEQAKKVLSRLKSGGFKAFLSPLEKGGKTVYRVRIGPFTERSAAQKVADQVRKKYRYDTWITR